MRLFDLLDMLTSKVGLLALLSVTAIAACGGESEPQQQMERPPAQVTVTRIHRTDVDVSRDYPARIYGSRQVQVRARVPGILMEKRYDEGQWVDRDELLFVLDPEPYRIALRRAEAEIADARAAHDHARREYDRISQLYDHQVVSERDRDQALTNFNLAKARLAMAEANLDDARRNLSYTEVRSPIAGVTGMEDVSEGNLIDQGGLLTTITQNDPVHARFSLPEADAAIRRTAMGNGNGDETNGPPAIVFPDGRLYARKGVIDFTSGTIDSRTGTVSARAVFPNPDHELIPGQFVRIRVRLQQMQNVFLIPEEAVSQGREGPRVFVVGDDDRAAARTVRLGPLVNGGQVILEGLKGADRLVVTGHVALQDGMPVAIRSAAGMPDQADQADQAEAR